eukprot:1655496-Amphidinium_carterae.1
MDSWITSALAVVVSLTGISRAKDCYCSCECVCAATESWWKLWLLLGWLTGAASTVIALWGLKGRQKPLRGLLSGGEGCTLPGAPEALEERRVLQRRWHHRLLLCRVEGAKWIAGSPDLDIEVLDLSTHRVLTVERLSAFPARAQGDAYVFDALEEGEEQRLIDRAHALARVLGVTPEQGAGVGTGEVWLYADPEHANFGLRVEPIPVEGPQCVMKNKVGLLQERDAWVYIEKVPETERSSWEDRKRAGAGRDLRVASAKRDGGGRRFSSLRESRATFRQRDFADWPFKGPRATAEFLESVESSGVELTQYHQMWVLKSGISQNASTSHTHGNVVSVLALAQAYDQLDMTNCAFCEFLTRWVLMTEAATRRNPKSPDYTNLSTYLAHGLDESGGALTSNFAKYVSDEQKVHAGILKQSRLFREELESETKRQQGGGFQAGAKKRAGKGGSGDAGAAASQ